MSEKVKSYIDSHWSECIKENKEDKDTLIGMPYPYIVPSVGYFDEMYYWDTFFTNKGLAISGMFDQVKNNTDNMLYLVDKYGFMPNGNRTYYLTRSQPPFLSAMVYDVYGHYRDKEWLHGAYLTLKKEYDFWMNKRIAPNGLNVYGSHNYTDRTLEYSAKQLEKRIGFMPEGDFHDLGYHTLAVCESGWDICSRWMFEVYNYNPVDLNSLMYLFEINMLYFSSELGMGEDDTWNTAAQKRKALMLEYMDNGEGVLLDYNFSSNLRSEVFSVASFYPMFVGLLDEKRAQRLVENLNRLEAEYGILTTEKNVIKGAYQWGYPNGWACLQYITIFALQKYGYEKDARRIARKYVDLVDEIFDKTGNLWEKYNVIDGSIDVIDEYKMPTMMGWSAGVYLAASELLENQTLLPGQNMKHLYFCACTEDGGVYHYTLENENLAFCEKVDLDKPMYLAIEGKKAYVILKETDVETKFGAAMTFDIDEKGKLVNHTKPMSSMGVVPCHLSVVNGEIYTVNYLSGNVVKLPDTVSAHSGKGPHPTRQTEAHTHFVAPSPDGKYILCTDLGLDSIFTYTPDLKQVSVAKVPDGYGARHLAFSEDGKLVYCVNELVSSVSVFEYENGILTYLDTCHCLPDFKEKNTAAAIRVKGKYLYISNRGADTISRLEINGKALRLLENTPCGGKNPRDFLIVGDFVFCTNEFTNDVTVLKLVDGKPTRTDIRLEMPNPLCVIEN